MEIADAGQQDKKEKGVSVLLLLYGIIFTQFEERRRRRRPNGSRIADKTSSLRNDPSKFCFYFLSARAAAVLVWDFLYSRSQQERK